MRFFILPGLAVVLTVFSTLNAQTVREPIALPDAVRMALENNLEVQIQRSEWLANDSRVWIAWGAFDPAFTYTATRESSVTEQNTREFISTGGVAGQGRLFEENNFRLGASMEGRTLLGTRYGVSLRADRLDNTLNQNPRASLYYPEHFSSLGFEVRQPLWKDFGTAANLAEVRIARATKNISKMEWQRQIIQAVATVLVNYYEMQFGFENIRVKQAAVEADRRLLEQNVRREQLGFLSPLDVRQAGVAVSGDEEELLVATNQFMESQFKLKRVILREREAVGGRTFEPVGVLKPKPIPVLNREAFIATAFERRLDYAQTGEEIKREDVRYRYAKNQAAPRVDIVGTYGTQGLESTYGKSFDETFNGPSDVWTLGVQVSIPFTNMQGRAQLATVRQLKMQAELRRKQVELTIVLDVDTALSRVETNRQRVETSRQSMRLAQEAVRIANRQFEVGKMSSFDVLEQRRKLYNAQTRELESIASLNVSLVQLSQAKGTLLDELGIRVEESTPKSPALVWPWTR